MQVLLLIMFVVYFAGGFQAFALGTYGVTFLDIFTLFFYFAFLFGVIKHNYKFVVPKSMLHVSIGLLVVSIVLSGLSLLVSFPAVEIGQYFKTFVHLAFLMLLSVIALTYNFDTKLIDKIFRLWLILSLIINIFGIYQIFARAFDLPLAWLDFTNVSMAMRGTSDTEDTVQQLSLQYGNFFRATSIFSEPSALATFNLYILILCIIPYIQKRKQFFESKVLNISIFVFALAGLFLTFSLTGVLGIAMILIAILLLESTRVRLRIVKILVAMAVLLVPADIVIEEYTETSVLELFSKRIVGILNQNDKMAESTDGESFGTRLETVNKSIIIWENSPIFGIGLGLTQYNKDVDMSFSDFSIMTALSELGIIGAFAFTLLFVALVQIGVKARKHIVKNNLEDKSLERQFGLIIYLVMVQIEINFFTQNNLVVPNLWLVIFFILVPSVKYLRMTHDCIFFRFFEKSITEKYLLDSDIK